MSRIIPLLLVAVAVGVILAYVHPTYTVSIADIKSEIKGYDGALEAARMFAEREAELVNQRNGIDPSGLIRVEQFLPDNVENVQLFLDLDSLASRTGMTIQDLDVSEVAAPATETQVEDASSLGLDAPIDHIDLTLSASGTYASMRAFVEGTEQSLRLLDLMEITLQDSATGVYSYDMRFRLYWLR